MRLFVDIIIVRKIPFLRTTSDDEKLGASSCIITITKQSLESSVIKVINLRKEGCFDIEYIDVDFQFECIEDLFSVATVEIYDADDHIEVIKRSIKAMNNGIRFVVNDNPFRRVHKSLVKRLFEVATRNLNSFTAEGGESEIFSP